MKTPTTLLIILLLLTPHLHAQLTMKLKMTRRQFVTNEKITAELSITNRAGRQLHLHSTPKGSWLDFIITRNGRPVAKTTRKAAFGAVKIPVGRAMAQTFNLASAYDLSLPGSYTVYCYVRIPGQPQSGFQSNRATFTVSSARVLYRQRIGSGSKLRELRLKRLAGMSRSTLYLEIEDVNNYRVLKTFPLGDTLPYFRPHATMDQHNRLHILFQSKPDKYTHLQISSTGDVTKRTHYRKGASGQPRLVGFADGEIKVAGVSPWRDPARRRKIAGQRIRRASERPRQVYR